MSNKFLLGVVAIGIFLGFVFFINFYSSETVIIEMTDSGFQPSELTIEKGTRVKFHNKGENDHWPASDFHPTHGIYSEFDSLEGVSPGDSWSFNFDKVGKWRMHDHLFPEYRGTIIVN
jgi:plastocyanin